MLKRRHYNFGNTEACVLCDHEDEETIQHLVLNYSFNTGCWDCLGIQWRSTENIFANLMQAKGAFAKPFSMEVFVTATWHI